jgi:hypothetical protein
MFRLGILNIVNNGRHGLPITSERAPIFGTIRWLFQEYRRSKAFTEKVSARSRPDYERTMQLIEAIVTKGDQFAKSKRLPRLVLIKFTNAFLSVLLEKDRATRKR